MPKQIKVKIFNESTGVQSAIVGYDDLQVDFVVDGEVFSLKRKSLYNYYPYDSVFCLRGRGTPRNITIPVLISAKDLNRVLEKIMKGK